jgi:transglutaminase-like putative cysteine protease
LLIDRSRRRPAALLRRVRRQRQPFSLGIEQLEERQLLDTGIGAAEQPSPIVVGRTPSAFTVDGIRNNQLTITYSVYNPRDQDVAGIRLTTTLGPGASFAGATARPDGDGEELAWSLGALPAFGRASVAVTVGLADPIPPLLDTGARAFGTTADGAVSDAAPPATIRTGSVAPELLAATLDADAADPSAQEKAAELDYDPQRILAYLRDRVGYESHRGSLRGARGTLWSGAGNALDEASLGVALLRASGIPTRYTRGSCRGTGPSS